jgi:hypothetical protein
MKLHRQDLELEAIVRRVVDGELDLQPDFQRGEIWDTKRRQRLIDTILRNWYVPAVHVVVEEGRESVLDGQQRLATIRAFFGDRFAVDGRIDPADDRIKELHGLRFSQLPAYVRRDLRRFPLTVVYLRDHTPGEPNELFFRLNQSYNLTPPEKRNALHGPARNQVKDLVRQMQNTGLLTPETVGFNNDRLAYDDIVARCCVAIEQNTLRRHINNTVVEEYYRSGKFSYSTTAGMERAAEELQRQVSESGRVKFNKGTLQTWFLYCYWASLTTGELPKNLLLSFESERARVKRREADQSQIEQGLLSMVNLYDNRASYRVTDVSSVRARDAAVHLFSEANFHTASHLGSEEVLDQLNDERYDGPSLILDFIEAVNWGEPLLEQR